MKLLLDENLSRRLVAALLARFPGSTQVTLVGLERASDRAVCDFAAQHGFVLCSKDDDFRRLLAVRGYRPRLVHLALGNATNDQVLTTLLAAADRIEAAFSDERVGVVTVGP
ncbi:MAG: DUF5615 family PIN-like protein [Rubrivivax sp.]|nr:DUF5615 family PIN-like protein [Rubrivivax sp.]